jgi:hypothetical protein
MFLDERGTGLRVTWHPERDLVVLSVWQEDSCVGTFRMPVQDIPRLSGLLAAALGDWVDQSGDPGAGGAGASGSGASGAGASGAGASGAGAGASGGVPGARITGEWDVGIAGIAGGGPGTEGAGSTADVGSGAGGGQAAGAGLSVQRRIRLSRPVLKLRGIQHRRRRSE